VTGPDDDHAIMLTRPHPSERAVSAGHSTGQVMVNRFAPGQVTARPRIDVGGGTVVALRQGTVIGTGEILDRGTVQGTQLVPASGPEGTSWWIPAEAVWSDGEAAAAPQHPRPVGLATAADVVAATVLGLSDRLGWEAVLHLERGHELPALVTPPELDPEQFVVLDGRLGHDIPTVVVIGRDLTRWGAAMSWEQALHRAMYGTAGRAVEPDELTAMTAALGALGLSPITVDLGTPLLRRLGIARCSVQLLAAS
jgi:hypothetical protein